MMEMNGPRAQWNARPAPTTPVKATNPIRVAIAGVGQSEVARPSDKSAMRLTLDACLEAIADAGLTREDIDGVACWPGDNNNGNSFSPVGPNALIGTMGLKVNWYGGGYEGPGPLAGLINGAMAIAAGLCRHVLVFRTITEASARRVDKHSIRADAHLGAPALWERARAQVEPRRNA